MSGLHDLAASALRTLDPEDAHRLTIRALALGLGPRAPRPDPILATTVAGLSLQSAVGLAAGFDKNAEVFGPMLAAGFGFVECGTVTPLPQAGNPRPRLFRLTEDRAVINRMGFNNEGLDAFAARLSRPGRPGPVGANIGANKDSADRMGDYVTGLKRLWGLADWFTLNISSPNTPGLRALQTRAALEELLGRAAEARDTLPAAGAVPLFLKVAPDLDDAEIEAVVETVLAFGISGIIVANTTISRPDLRSPQAGETGGLSGAPLRDLAQSVLGRFSAASAGRLPLIGAGGIASGADAYARIRAGASAVQLYSALVYEGPGLAVRIGRELASRLRADGFRTLAEAVGAR
ncbi:quinone-dependent dihydroorotate dehydrogenase [Phenylobacterium sp.]|jgi:dihydroorotate dehydrogenase|uniref:quinone-dependent dihydroorotate dehydrogenase n=1 Tax=Phenylobacterium sp. TaxID=1871053 RepID=UPI0025F18239|nr:quinone-dependent dihydroorotate dehydrogenase [Phenylobacterium sp.]MCA3721004.1 quinone-dependent dihydroorotate dehydrogenase [Phenylobacterium sp.]